MKSINLSCLIAIIMNLVILLRVLDDLKKMTIDV